MKKFNKNLILAVFIVLFAFGFTLPVSVIAATTPSLGMAGTFGILSSTFTHNIGLTGITGDLGYTTSSGSGTYSVASGTDYHSGSPYSTAGTDQGTALTALNTQVCTFTFANGPINLSTDTTHGPIGVYTPGVYCTGAASAASVGTAGVILNGSGTYIFIINGAFTTVDNSHVSLTGGATSCDVFWAPTAATTLGANTSFTGTIIDDSGITIGHNTTITGRMLSFGGTITTDTDTINSTCGAPAPSPATLHVVKTVANNNGGSATASSFNLHVKLAGSDVAGSPAVGVSSSGRLYTLAAGTYVVSEDTNSAYVQSFSGSCDASGTIALIAGEDATCTITNHDIAFSPQGNGGGQLTSLVPPLIDVIKIPTPLALPQGPGLITYNYKVSNIGTVPISNVVVTDNKCSSVNFVSGDTNNNSKLDTNEIWNYSCAEVISQTTTNTVTATGQFNGLYTSATADATVTVTTPVVIVTPTPTITPIIVPTVIPTLPKTGFPPEDKSTMLPLAVLAGIFAISIFLYFARKKQTI